MFSKSFHWKAIRIIPKMQDHKLVSEFETYMYLSNPPLATKQTDLDLFVLGLVCRSLLIISYAGSRQSHRRPNQEKVLKKKMEIIRFSFAGNVLKYCETKLSLLNRIQKHIVTRYNLVFFCPLISMFPSLLCCWSFHNSLGVLLLISS